MLIGNAVFAVTKFFGFGKFPSRYRDNPAENLNSNLLYRSLASNDEPGIYVHVATHSGKGFRIPADFQYRRNHTADYAAASGGKQDYVRTAGNQIENSLRVIRVAIAKNER